MNDGLFPTSAIVRSAEQDVAALTAEIHLDLKAAEESDWDRLRRYRKIGENLCRVKAACKGKRGAWGNWLKKEWPKTSRRARQHMLYSKTEAASVLEEEEANWQRASGHASDDEAGDEEDNEADEELAVVDPSSPWPEREVQLRERLEDGETVVININVDLHLLGWARAHDLFVLVDRQTQWGNPFRLDEDGSRDEVIHKHATYYLPYKNKLMAEIGTLKGKVLGCHCAPDRCHADRLAELANQQED